MLADDNGDWVKYKPWMDAFDSIIHTPKTATEVIVEENLKQQRIRICNLIGTIKDLIEELQLYQNNKVADFEPKE